MTNTPENIPASFLILEDRGIITVSGIDSRSFLQGLISNDTDLISPELAIHAAFLTPQGKYLHDFIIYQQGTELLIDCDGARLADLLKRLTMYKLRADVTLADRTADYTVAALIGGPFGESALQNLNAIADPRHSAMGYRAVLDQKTAEAILSDNGLKRCSREDYERIRLTLGVPDGQRDLIIDKSILLESGFDELNGISWKKGCYIGQELTARTKHRGLIKKRLVPVTFDGPPPPFGTTIQCNDKEAGEMRSSIDGLGLALMRLEYITEGTAELVAGETVLTPSKPDWADF